MSAPEPSCSQAVCRNRAPEAPITQNFAIRFSLCGDLPVRRQARHADDDITHAIEHHLAAGEDEDGKVLYLGPDRAGNLLEVVSVRRDDGTELVIHAMGMRRKYEPFLHGKGGPDD